MNQQLKEIKAYANSLTKSKEQRRTEMLIKLLNVIRIEFDTTEKAIKSDCRERWTCVYPRQLFCWIAYHKLHFKLKEIALFLGYKEHSMAIYGRDTWDNMIIIHKKFKQEHRKEMALHNKTISQLQWITGKLEN